MLGDGHPGRIQLDARALLAARRRRGLSRSALVDLAEPDFPISEATVKRAEKGRPINLEKASTLARVLGIPLDSLLPERGRAAYGAPPAHPGDPPGTHRASRTAPLVGRRAELERLTRAAEGTEEGRPSLLLLRGEPGIGKTRLLRELRRGTEPRGIRFRMGQAHEHGTYAFQPVIDALSPPGALLEGLDAPSAGLLRRFLASGPAPRERADERRGDHALLRAVVRALLAVPEPTLLVLDDLQWLDGASLDLLEHVGQALARAAEEPGACRVALVATYRSEELPPGAARVVRRLEREELAEGLELRTLARAETFELVSGLGVRPSPGLVDTLHEATHGNPLFVQETLRLLRTRGALFEEGGFAVTRLGARDLELPESAAGVIARRAECLEPESRRTLVRAAFLGPRFELRKLAVVLRESEEEVLESLEEAVSEGFLHNRGQEFEFPHPLTRHVFHQEPISARAQRIHLEIAERLERSYGPRAEENAREIADHLVRAGPLADPERVARFARLAADRARALWAWAEEGRFLDALLAVRASEPGADDGELGELHRRAAVALHRCWDVGPSFERYDAAIAAFERAGDRKGLAHALNDRIRLADNLGLQGETERANGLRLEEVLSTLGDEEPRLRGQILDTLATVRWGRGEGARAGELARSALALAEAEGDDDLAAQVSTSIALSHLEALELDAAAERWRRGAEYARRAEDPLREVRCLQRLPLPLLMRGRLEEAAAHAASAWERSGLLHNPGEASIPRWAQAALALLRGELGHAERLAEETLGILRRRRYAWVGPFVLPTLARAAALRGDAAGAVATLDAVSEPGLLFDDPRRFARAARRWRWLLLAWAAEGRRAAAPREEVRRALGGAPAPRRLDPAALARCCVEVELARSLDLPELATAAAPALAQAAEAGVRVEPAWGFLLARVRGVAAGLAGRLDEAEGCFEEALGLARAVGAETERLQTLLDRAEARAERGGPEARRRAHEGAAEAGALARKIGAELLAVRAARLAAADR